MLKYRLLLAAVLILSALGCSNFGYYTQAMTGQLEVYRKTRPIEKVLHDPAADAALKAKLADVLKVREFASDELGLPRNDSYRAYADVKRPYVLWNVFATPELSLKPKEWCHLVAGCTAYRGYFAQRDANEFAQQLRGKGYDVHVGGVSAYSTLGWFRDPLLNTVVERPVPEIAGLIFHELAHQQVYVKGDTAFNESFAVAVELEGVRRWLLKHGAPGDYEKYAARLKRREEFVSLTRKYRDRLEAMYAAETTEAEKRAGKRQVFADLRTEYQQVKVERWNGFQGYDAWFAQDLNNAHLLSLGLYNQHVPAFQALLVNHAGDMKAFYAAAKNIGTLPNTERVATLGTLLPIASADAEVPTY
jgi:predicted aminopeptidase